MELIKVELVNEAAKLAGMTREDTLRVAEAISQVIRATLAKGEKITLVGFGAFEVQHRAARKGRNPQKPTVEIDIPEKNVPRFRAGKNLKEAVNPPKPKPRAKKKK
jgi:DNA-binding protein HU-beta